MTAHPILNGEPLDFIFAMSDEIGVECGCPAHVDLTNNLILISVDSDAFGSLVMRIVDERPKRFSEDKALPIAIEAVEGAIREVFNDHYEPLFEMARRYDPERLAPYVLNEAAMELLLISMHDSVVYLSALSDAVAEMRVEAELVKAQRVERNSKAANGNVKPPKGEAA